MSALKDIISGIELDAAWQRAKDLEDERDRALQLVRYLQAERDSAGRRNTDLMYGLGDILFRYAPDTAAMTSLLGELNQLWTATSGR